MKYVAHFFAGVTTGGLVIGVVSGNWTSLVVGVLSLAIWIAALKMNIL